MRPWYLATPYRAYPCGLDAAYKAAVELTEALHRRGVIVFSPVVYTHPLALVAGGDPQSDDWLAFDEHFMRVCRGMVIGKLAGWDLSEGIKWEQKWFKERALPICRLSVPLPDQLPGALR